MSWMTRTIPVCLAIALGATAGGCAVEDEFADDPVQAAEDLLSQLDPETEQSYNACRQVSAGCEVCGDCIYCEDRSTPLPWLCTEVCYFAVCLVEDYNASGCYEDCSRRVEAEAPTPP